MKKTLEKDRLKLDRNGFSESGDAYLKKVYEAVVASARKALKHFGDGKCDNASKITDNIIGSIKELLAKETDGEEQRASTEGSGRKRLGKSSREAEEVILSAAALAYFAMLYETDDLFDSPSISENTVWNTLVKKMIALLNNTERWQGDDERNRRVIERINAVRENSSLYRIRIRAYNDMWEGLASKRKEDSGADNTYASVLDIIEGDRKYAVVSVRDERSRFWKEILVELNADVHAKIKENVKKLRRTDNLMKRREIMSALDDMARPLLEMAGRKDDSEIGQIRKEGVILKWILNNVPSMALFSSTDGNTRVNILDREICHSVYYDNGMRALTIEKIRDKYARNCISRFSTTVWSGYGYLGVEKPRVSIQPVKRGKISDIGSSSLIVPLSGEQLEKLYQDTEKQLESLKEETSRIYTSIIQPISEFIAKKAEDNQDDQQNGGKQDGAYQINKESTIYWDKLCKMLVTENVQNVEKPDTLDELDELLLEEELTEKIPGDENLLRKKLSEEQCKKIVRNLKISLSERKAEDTKADAEKISADQERGDDNASEGAGQGMGNASTGKEEGTEDSSSGSSLPGEGKIAKILPSYLEWLKKIWGENENSFNEQLPEKYQDIRQSIGFQNLLKYTEENAGMKSSRKQIEALYLNYIFEMQDAMRLKMERNMLKDFNGNFRNALINRVWLKKSSENSDSGQKEDEKY